MKKTLTEALIDKASVNQGTKNVFDTRVSGLYVRIFPHRKVFMLKTRHGGKQVYHNIGTYPQTSLSDARSRAAELISTRPVTTTHKKLTLQTILASFLRANASTLKPSTLKDMEYRVTKYAGPWLDTSVSAFTPETALAISSHILPRVTCRNTTIRYLRRLFSWAGRLYSVKNPFEKPAGLGIHTPSTARRVPRLYSSLDRINTLVHFFHSLGHDRLAATRDLGALALFLALTGIRHGDAKRLTYGDIYPDGFYMLRDTKNRNDYALPLPAPFLFLSDWRPLSDVTKSGLEKIRSTKIFLHSDLRTVLSKAHTFVLSRQFADWHTRGDVGTLCQHDLRRIYTSVASTVVLDGDIIDRLTCRTPTSVKAKHYMQDVSVSELCRLSSQITERLFDERNIHVFPEPGTVSLSSVNTLPIYFSPL